MQFGIINACFYAYSPLPLQQVKVASAVDVKRASNPNRFKPALAKIMASYSLLSKRPKRVPTLPRKSRKTRSGRKARTWH
jgi:hypothetical protein